MGRTLGDPVDPLLVSVRSGAKFSMPGMMDTILNIGLSDDSVQGLAKQAGNERFAWDSYRRLIQMFGKTVLGIDGEQFERALDSAKKASGAASDTDLDAEDLRNLTHSYQEIVRAQTGRDFPQDPREQLDLAIRAVFELLERRPGGAVPAAGAHPGRPRHGRERGRDGLRQPGRRLRHRGRVHPRPGDRRARRLRRLPAERAGRGRRGRHPQHRPAAGPGAHGQGVLRRADVDHGHPGGPLPRPVRHRVHDRARQALDAADPGRQADGGGGLPHRDRAGRTRASSTWTRRSPGSPGPSWPG